MFRRSSNVLTARLAALSVGALVACAGCSMEVDPESRHAPVIRSPADGALLDDATPEVTGESDPNVQVELLDRDGEVLGTTRAIGIAWSITPRALADGEHELTARAVHGGRAGRPSEAVTIVIDTIAPDAPTVTSPESGSYADGARVPLEGSAESGSRIEVTTDGESIADTTTGDDGRWASSTARLEEGEHELRVTATDAAGNRSDATSLSVIVDTAYGLQPVISSPMSGASTNDPTPELTGAAEPGETLWVKGDAQRDAIGMARVADDGTFSVTTSTLADGTYELRAHTTDAAGNRSPLSEPVMLDVDTVAPGAPVIGAPAGGSVLSTLAFVRGTAEARATVAVHVDGVPAGSDIASGAIFTVYLEGDLTEGAHTLVAVATDAAGNVSEPSASVGFELDRTPPPAPTFTLGTRTEVVGGALPIEGHAEANADVALYDDFPSSGEEPLLAVSVGADGRFALTTPALDDGSHVFTVVVADAAGLTSSAQVNLTVDTTAPEPPTILGTSGGSVAGPGTVRISIDAGVEAGVEVTVDGEVYDAARSSTGWYVLVSGLNEGAHTLSAVVRDLAGNVSAASDPFELTVDLTEPVVDAGADQLSNAPAPLDASVSDLTAVTYQWSVVSGPGTLSFSDATVEDPSVSADAEGVYVLALTVTDAALQSSVDYVSYELDVTPPTVVAHSPAADETDVDVGRSVRVVLSEPIAPATLPDNLTLDGGAVAGSTSVKPGDTTVAFTPGQLLSAATTYGVALLAGLTDPAGNAVASVSWSFTTAGAAPRVEPLYTNGRGWNDYVVDDGPDALHAQNTVCDASAADDYFACLHGGVLRKLDTAGSSCSYYSATDALDAFEWTCDDSGGTAVLISTGLRPGKRLSDLIDFELLQWKPNSVSVAATGPATSFTTGNAEWWSNEVLAVPEDAPLDRAGTVYVLRDTQQLGVRIEADGVALVTHPAATLVGNYAIAPEALWAGAQDFLWLEGNVDGALMTTGITFEGTRMSVLDHVAAWSGIPCIALVGGASANLVSNAVLQDCATGIWIGASHRNTVSSCAARDGYAALGIHDGATGNVVTAFEATYNEGDAVELDGSSGNTLSSIIAVRNMGHGVRLVDSPDNRLRDVRAVGNGRGVVLDRADGTNLSRLVSTNNAFDGFTCVQSSNLSVSGVLAAANNDRGIVLSDCDDSRLGNLSVVNNYFAGVMLTGSSNNFLWNVATVSNGMGIELGNGSNLNSVHNLVSAHSDYYGLSPAPSYGVSLSNASGNRFTGVLKVGSNADGDCYVDMESTSGDLSDDTGGIDAVHQGTCNTTAAALSSFMLSSGVSAAASFVGKVGTDGPVDVTADDANPDDDSTPGLCDAGDITDWVSFEHGLRSWGAEGGAFPSFDNRGTVQTGTVRIWDFSPNSADAGDGGGPVLWSLLATPDGNDVLEHAWGGSAATASDCTAIVAGSIFVGVDDCRSTFLRDAVELDGDGVGNDNGLCESDEACLHTPNIGAYQGHGPLQSTGNFGDGTVTGVTLLEHADNGY